MTAYFKTKITRRNTIAQDPWHSRLLIGPWKLPFFGAPVSHRIRKSVRWQDSSHFSQTVLGVGAGTVLGNKSDLRRLCPSLHPVCGLRGRGHGQVRPEKVLGSPMTNTPTSLCKVRVPEAQLGFR